MVLLGNGGIGIRQQGKRQLKPLGISRVLVGRRGVEPEGANLDSTILIYLIAHGGELAVSAGGIVPGVKHQEHRRFPEQLG
jgi:hypothetical protein